MYKRQALGFDQKPVLLFMGGSQGSAAVNAALEEALGAILMEYNVIHVRGKGNLNPSLTQQGYKPVSYTHLGRSKARAALSKASPAASSTVWPI